jgi:hypothetical protein
MASDAVIPSRAIASSSTSSFHAVDITFGQIENGLPRG